MKIVNENTMAETHISNIPEGKIFYYRGNFYVKIADNGFFAIPEDYEESFAENFETFSKACSKYGSKAEAEEAFDDLLYNYRDMFNAYNLTESFCCYINDFVSLVEGKIVIKNA